MCCVRNYAGSSQVLLGKLQWSVVKFHTYSQSITDDAGETAWLGSERPCTGQGVDSCKMLISAAAVPAQRGVAGEALAA